MALHINPLTIPRLHRPGRQCCRFQGNRLSTFRTHAAGVTREII